MRIDYKNEVIIFDQALKDYDELLLPVEDDEFGICKELSRVRAKKESGNNIDFTKINNLFLGSISKLGLKTRNFYETRLPKITVVRDNFILNGEAYIVGIGKKEQLYMTASPLKEIDLATFSHELGHVPTIENTSHKDYYEYGEILSIYFEYLSLIYSSGKKGEEIFEKIRMSITRDEALQYMNDKKHLKGDNSYRDRFTRNDMRECMRYIKSFDYALQLIERSKDNQQLVNKKIDEIITSNNSFRKIKEELDIDTKGCKMLSKRAKQYI